MLRGVVSYVSFVVIIGLCVLMVSLAGQSVEQYRQLRALKSEHFELNRAAQLQQQQRREYAKAKVFMEQAAGFVEKATAMGIRDGHVNRYVIDFSQLVSITKIPLLLEQSKSTNGRYYAPLSMSIAREGIVVSDNLDERLRSAIRQRQRDYKLSFNGKVFVVNHES